MTIIFFGQNLGSQDNHPPQYHYGLLKIKNVLWPFMFVLLS